MAFLDTATQPASHPESQRLAIPDSPSPQAKLRQPRGSHKKRHNAHHKQNASSPAAVFLLIAVRYCKPPACTSQK